MNLDPPLHVLRYHLSVSSLQQKNNSGKWILLEDVSFYLICLAFPSSCYFYSPVFSKHSWLSWLLVRRYWTFLDILVSIIAESHRTPFLLSLHEITWFFFWFLLLLVCVDWCLAAVSGFQAIHKGKNLYGQDFQHDWKTQYRLVKLFFFFQRSFRIRVVFPFVIHSKIFPLIRNWIVFERISWTRNHGFHRSQVPSN